MLSRLAYTLRETWASFQRNVTLTVAAIITAAVSLLIFGLTLLIQHGFDNLLSKWEGGVEMIVFVQAQATEVAIDDVGIIPLHYQVNTWALRRGFTYKPRTDEYTLATGVGKAN